MQLCQWFQKVRIVAKDRPDKGDKLFDRVKFLSSINLCTPPIGTVFYPKKTFIPEPNNVFYFLKNDVEYEYVLSSMKRLFLKCRLTPPRSKDMKGVIDNERI